MKRTITVSLMLMGFSFTVTQALLIRELLVSFSGNELSIGLILGAWLMLEALGSGVLGRIGERWNGDPASYATLQVLTAILLPLGLTLAYHSRTIAGASPGEGVGLGAIALVSALVLLPIAIADGAMFTFGVRSYARLTGGGTPSIGWVYALEAAGAMAGGILFTFLLIPNLFALQIVLMLSALNLLSASALFIVSIKDRRPRVTTWRVLTLIPLLAGTAVILFTRLASDLQRWGNASRWRGFDLAFSEQSIYGEVSVVKIGAQATFYADGVPIFTSPVPDLALAEELVHLPMLFVPEARNALVLSGGVGGVIGELTKYPFERIDYAELDPTLIRAVQLYPSELTQRELSDPRVTIEYVDGRWLVRQKLVEDPGKSARRYDLVVINLPSPTTLRLNRFYTLEFYRMVREIMVVNGVLVLKTPGSLSYMNDELRTLNSSVRRTLAEVFPAVLPIPDETTLWLASPSGVLDSTNLEQLIERWDRRALESQLITAPHIRLKLEQESRDWFLDQLAGSELEARINSDLRPVGTLYGIAYWSSIFSPGLAAMLRLLKHLTAWMLAPLILACGALAHIAARRSSERRVTVLPIVVASTGFAGMAADLLVIFTFQSLYGYVYHWIGLLIAAFMAGLGLGGLWMTRRFGTHIDEKRTLLKIEFAMLGFWISVPVGLALFYLGVPSSVTVKAIQWALLPLNGLAGFLVGAQFALSNRMWIRRRDLVGRRAGALYAFDLIGAFLAAILVAVVLIPVLGVIQTSLLTAAVKGISLLLALQIRG